MRRRKNCVPQKNKANPHKPRNKLRRQKPTTNNQTHPKSSTQQTRKKEKIKTAEDTQKTELNPKDPEPTCPIFKSRWRISIRQQDVRGLFPGRDGIICRQNRGSNRATTQEKLMKPSSILEKTQISIQIQNISQNSKT